MNERKYKTGGVVGTILFHALILVCFFLFGFSSPLPPPPEEGVEVNLGYSEDGMGEIQPDQPASEDASSPPSSDAQDDVSTQNTEESHSLDKKNNSNNKTTTPQEDAVNKNALYPGKKNPGGSEGETGKPGDQGHPDGDPDAKNHYGTPGPGGVSFNLSGRNKKSLPKPEYNSRDEGIVVVSIWVDKNGNVTKAIPGARGTTTTSTYLLNTAKAAALKAKFHEKADAPEEQKGTITYNFINLN